LDEGEAMPDLSAFQARVARQFFSHPEGWLTATVSHF
jgi:hypothetical protein